MRYCYRVEKISNSPFIYSVTKQLLNLTKVHTEKDKNLILKRSRKKHLLSTSSTSVGGNVGKRSRTNWRLMLKFCTHTKKNLVHTWSVLGTTHISPCLCRSDEVITIGERINFIAMKTCLENTTLKDLPFYIL